jgi:DNA-binding PucR family transcriptional regulator
MVSGPEGRLGIGPARPAVEAHRSYRRAREALRFAQGPGARPIAYFDQLGSVVALAAVADTDLMDLQDRIALAELSRTETGLAAILTAEVLMRTGSQREAAASMNLHHSTVAHRVGHVEQALGYGLGEHSNWFRAQLAIHLWRLSWPDPVSTASSARWRTATAEVPPSA